MKRLIIGGLIAAGIAFVIGVGISVFTCSTNGINTNNNLISNNIAPPNVTNGNGNNSNINYQNSKSNTNSNFINKENTNSNNTTTQISTPQNSNFKMNYGTGKLDNLIQNTSVIYGTVANGAQFVIALGKPTSNGQIFATEHYLNEPDEQFNIYISAFSNGMYKMYEYYNGVHTGTYRFTGCNGTMQGSFTKAGSTKVLPATFSSNNIGGRHTFQENGFMNNYPFYNGEIDGTNVCWVNTNNGFIEYYNNDANAFNIQANVNAQSNQYQSIYDETYNGVKTGEYLLNYDKTTNTHVGIFKKYKNGKVIATYNVSFKGSLIPNYGL